MIKKILLITSIVFAVSSVVLTIESVTTSAEVASLQKKQSDLLTLRRDLQGDLVSAISTSDLEEKSISLGFSQPSDLIYIGGNFNVASKN